MTDLSNVFTLPLAEGNYPFKLSAEEMNLNGDDWAWLFLRLNPLYRHDYNLYRGIHWNQWRALRELYRPGELLFPAQPVSNPPHVIVKGNGIQRRIPNSVDQLPKQLAGMDSRYFTINKEQLTGKLEGFKYTPVTLHDYLMSFEGPIPFGSLAFTDFVASRTFGIATWIDPDFSPQLENSITLSDPTKDPEPNTVKADSNQIPDSEQNALKAFVLEHLPKSQSWFYLGNEPLWQVNTWVVESQKMFTHKFNDVEYIVGTKEAFSEIKHLTHRHDKDGKHEVQMTAKVGEPLPTVPPGISSTDFHFLVCLDGYVKPQVELIKPLAEAFKALHKEYHPASVTRGRAWTGTPTIFDPERKPINLSLPTVRAYYFMNRDPNRLRQHWRQVTIDVAGPLNQQYKAVVHALEQEQIQLGDQLTFPVRRRAGNKPTTGDHWLKMALCAVELHTCGMKKDESDWYSQQTMREAFFDPTSELYLKVRGKPSSTTTKVTTANRVISTKSDKLDSEKLGRVRDALDNGKNLVLGWHEFIATLDFTEKVVSATYSEAPLT